MASVDKDCRAWGRRGRGLLSEGGAGAGFHSPCHPLPRTPWRGQLWGWGGPWGGRWGHGPAPLCCPPGGKTLRDRAELGVGGALNTMRGWSFHLDQTGEGSGSDPAGRGCRVHCLLPAAPLGPSGPRNATRMWPDPCPWDPGIRDSSQPLSL